MLIEGTIVHPMADNGNMHKPLQKKLHWKETYVIHMFEKVISNPYWRLGLDA